MITKVEWTVTITEDGTVLQGYTFNPWHGCEKISRGCKFCYAEALDNRWSNNEPHWGKHAPRRFFDDEHWRQPYIWNDHAKKVGYRLKVFCGSMCDYLEDREDLVTPRKRLFTLIERTPNLDWLLLTKRPENLEKMLPPRWQGISIEDNLSARSSISYNMPPNVWLGCTVCKNEEIHTVWPVFEGATRSIMPRISFLSIEPLVDHLADIELITEGRYMVDEETYIQFRVPDWVIIGGESGNKSGVAQMHSSWAHEAVDHFRECDIPVFFKQFGTVESSVLGLPGKGNTFIDGYRDIDLLKIREFPAINYKIKL